MPCLFIYNSKKNYNAETLQLGKALQWKFPQLDLSRHFRMTCSSKYEVWLLN